MSVRISTNSEKKGKTILMSAMKPLQAGRTIDGGILVLRTASIDKFEVINLSDPDVGGCWTSASVTLRVQLLTEPITIEIDGK